MNPTIVLKHCNRIRVVFVMFKYLIHWHSYDDDKGKGTAPHFHKTVPAKLTLNCDKASSYSQEDNHSAEIMTTMNIWIIIPYFQVELGFPINMGVKTNERRSCFGNSQIWRWNDNGEDSKGKIPVYPAARGEEQNLVPCEYPVTTELITPKGNRTSLLLSCVGFSLLKLCISREISLL